MWAIRLHVARHRCGEGATAYTQTVKRQPIQLTVFHDLATGYEIGKYRKLFSDDTSRELDASDQVK